MLDLQKMALRSDVLRQVRDAFYREGFLEVTTATRIAAPAPEEFIEAVRAENGFLRTSPELEMKRLLAAGMKRIFQLGPCFRSGERGSRHREEFTMLEYYAAGWDYRKLAEFSAAMFCSVIRAVRGGEKFVWRGHSVDASKYEFLSVEDAYRKYAGVSCREAENADRFDEWMVTKIEPRLGDGKLTFLIDYPANRASLSQLCPENPAYAQRWEMYCCGMELGNAFGELTDAAEQKARFAASKQFRAQSGMNEYPEPVEFFAALEKGLPASSGCAIGFDRLLMLAADAADIGEVTFE